MNAASASQTWQTTARDRTLPASHQHGRPDGSFRSARATYDSGIDRDYEDRLRTAAMKWLDDRGGTGQVVLSFGDLSRFTFEGRRVPLMDRQRGIRKPRHMAAALSIRTRFTAPGKIPPYADTEGPDGLLRYKYRGSDPAHSENVALQDAYKHHLPLIWFVASAEGAYVPIYPIWIVGEEAAQNQFVVAFDATQRPVPDGDHAADAVRSYAEWLTRQRLHQPVFRVRVLTAYGNRCAICGLPYPSLLDAAHILPDRHPLGAPIVPNGLSLCKLHHAAYDANLLGIRPDRVVEVCSYVRLDVGGPMLRHGLQEMVGVRLLTPRSRAERPDPARLKARYEDFLRGDRRGTTEGGHLAETQMGRRSGAFTHPYPRCGPACPL